MRNQSIDHVPSSEVATSKQPENLPHGLLTPPQKVRELIDQERAKCAPETFAKAEERLMNEWTIGFYFDGLNHEVLYRPTPDGPEVAAVGTEEVLALKKNLPLEVQRELRTFLGY